MAAKYTDGLPNGSGFWHINDISNGIEMLNSLHLTGHSAYLATIENRLASLRNTISSNDYQQAYNFLTNFTNTVKQLIIDHPNLNVGEIALLIP